MFVATAKLCCEMSVFVCFRRKIRYFIGLIKYLLLNIRYFINICVVIKNKSRRTGKFLISFLGMEAL